MTDLNEAFSIVGKPLIKPDAFAKVSGQTKFADDLALPRMLYGRILRSPHPHARLLHVDTDRARALPGVLAVLTGDDLPIKFGILPVSQDEEALAREKVRYVGDPVAAVAATDEWIADEALDLIEAQFQELPPVMSIDQAIAAEGEPIHGSSNVHKAVALEFGDTEDAMRTAEHIREDVVFFEGNTHLPMEQHAAVAQYSADGKLTLWTSSQTPHYVHRALGKVLEMPMSRIRVVATPNGGGFGGKSDIFSHELVAAKLAIVTGRPVKITLTREEVFYAHRGRHPVLMKVRTGFTRDGRIRAMQFQSFLDGGGYGSYGVASTYYTGALQATTYAIPRYRFEGVRLFTNKPPCGPKRGHGTPQPRFALETHFDKVAEELGIDPVALRLKNLPRADSRTVNWLRITSCGLEDCIDKVVAGSRFLDRRTSMPARRGLGFAVSSYLSGAGTAIYWNDMPHSEVQLKLDRNGGVALLCGAIDIGQGSDHILAAIVPGQLFIAGHVHGGQRGQGGGGERPGPALRGGGRGAAVRHRRADRARPPDLPPQPTGRRSDLRPGGAARRDAARRRHRDRQLHAAQAGGALQRIGGRSQSRLLILGGGGRSGLRCEDRGDQGHGSLGRARYRSCHQPDAGDRTG
ncbi:MAG: hypothetical protein AUG49_14315 [Catenulispora sp. 13_1_20CM_3_70_7]|nr:MAG: hypothetical protein AUG49_14315 [Catenulispora sp. 13_1_20CM_3_70_7]